MTDTDKPGDPPEVTLEFPAINDTGCDGRCGYGGRCDCRRGWWRYVSKVDPTQTGGYAFKGSFLNPHPVRLPVGAAVIAKSPPLSAAEGGWLWHLFRVTGGGVIAEGIGADHCGAVDGVLHICTKPHAEFLAFRDAVAEVVAVAPRRRRKPAGLVVSRWAWLARGTR